jgi:hypothetical protein
LRNIHFDDRETDDWIMLEWILRWILRIGSGLKWYRTMPNGGFLSKRCQAVGYCYNRARNLNVTNTVIETARYLETLVSTY